MAEELECGACGATVAPGAFCRRCGKPLDGPAEAGQEVFPDLEAASPVPEVPQAGTRRLFVVIGAVLAAAAVGGIGVWALSRDPGGDSFSSSDVTSPVVIPPDTTLLMPSTTPRTAASTPATTEATTTTDSAVAAEQPVESSTVEATPFRFSYPTIGELPPMPTAVAGHVPYEGEDSFGQSGQVRKATVRVFESTPGFTVIPEFSGQMNGCSDTFWVARWVSKNPDVRVVATNEVVAVTSSGEDMEVEPWLLPPEAPAGMLGGSICSQPGFSFISAVNGNEANLVDVAVEWTYFDRDVFNSGSDPASSSDTASCSGYTYDDELPISVCSQGFSVELFQEALGLPADGYFGPGTEAAVREFQGRAGLAVSGVMDAATWSALGVTSAAPYPDLNGDGVVDGSEFPGG